MRPEHPESDQKSLSEPRPGSLSFRNRAKVISTQCGAREIVAIGPEKCPPTREQFPSPRDNCPDATNYK